MHRVHCRMRFGIPDGILVALHATLGNFQRVCELVAMSRNACLQGIEDARVAFDDPPQPGSPSLVIRPLNTLEQGQAGMLRRAPRCFVESPGNDDEAPAA